jgi:hypothetical protein
MSPRIDTIARAVTHHSSTDEQSPGAMPGELIIFLINKLTPLDENGYHYRLLAI